MPFLQDEPFARQDSRIFHKYVLVSRNMGSMPPSPPLALEIGIHNLSLLWQEARDVTVVRLSSTTYQGASF